MSTFSLGPETVYTSLSHPAFLFDWLITPTLTLVSCDNFTLDQSAGSKSEVYVDFFPRTRDRVHFTLFPALLFDWLFTLTLTLVNCDDIMLE